MNRIARNTTTILLTILAMVIAMAATAMGTGAAVAATPPDPAKVPHYFGPWPNWANSPLTLNQASVTFNGTGTGAAAVAQVDPASGGISAIDITSPGQGYDATTTVTIAGGTTAATATATVSASDVVTGFTNVVPGSGYSAFKVDLNGGVDLTVTGNAAATAIGSGGVDAVTVTDAGSGYSMPTVDFDYPDDPNGTQATGHVVCVETADCSHAPDATVSIASVVVDEPGSGYTTAPAVNIRNGTQYDPINFPDGTAAATASATLKLTAVNVLAFGKGYTSAPTVVVTDPTGTGSGAGATALTDGGAITAVAVDTAGAGYLTKGMRKFVDDLPGLCSPPACPATGKYLPTAVPQVKKYTDTSVTPNRDVAADEYVIGLVQYRTSFSSDLPPTLVRGYVQIETPANADVSQHFPLTNANVDPSLPDTPVLINGTQAFAVTPPQYLGPIISATRNKPTRIVFRNLLPTGAQGDLFLPTDSSMMGSGMVPMTMPDPVDQKTVDDAIRNPECTQAPKGANCFKDDRATLHLHGGTTPWISDGTPHQWITPAGESTSWPQGVSVQNVPDMKDATGATLCDAKDDGCQTFFYTNQQSARLMFYHDHAWGITRLNVYAGEAAGYLIADDTEKKLVADGTIPGAADTLPLIIQDKTFVPGDQQLKDVKDTAGNVTSYGQDPTWDNARWGGQGSLWYHHVYMPAQNPGDASGMSAYGRWMYGPWFWPPASGTKYGPIPNPYYSASCKIDVPSTWQYQTDPFCEPELIPGTPNISAGMEQFNDTPLVNGVAYPKVTLDPKPYRLRMLNAANDRFFDLQWYTADPDPANGNGKTEVKLNPAELLAAQTDPNVSPTPADAHNDASGPDWVQFANEGGFLPTPTVIDGQQPTTWITDPTRFDVGNVDQHSMLLAPAERADAVVDFSKFAGKTLILYNDAPAAFPARVPGYDYYTGAPDLSPTGAPKIFPGYGPNTRTVMQVTINAGTPSAPFDVTKLKNAFAHKANGSGVFESSQHPPIVGQAAYNSAMGSSFAATGECKAAGVTKCDGLVRVNDTGSFTFNTLKSPTTKTTVAMEPKAIHDETNSTTFDEFGRMQANLGIEAQPPTPGAQNVTLYPFVNPQTELIDGTNLPKQVVTTDSVTGEPVSDVKISPISDAKDGTQIWRVTHNGVDTHPIHFHLYDVQVLNRVTWDNIIIPNDANENGWKDTVRMSPLEDTIVALRPIIPQVPFEVPNSVRPLNPMMPANSGAMFFNTDPQGNPLATPITNQTINFGWEYVWHCHILSHEEMDMMRPVSLALPPIKPDGLASAFVDVLDRRGRVIGQNVTLTWNDNSITETRFVVKRTTDGTTWTTVGTLDQPLGGANKHGVVTFTDTTSTGTTAYKYQVVAENVVGYGSGMPSMTVSSSTAVLGVNAPTAPTGLSATLAGTSTAPRVNLTWQDTATTEARFIVQRSTDNGATFTQLATVAPRTGTGAVTYTDSTVALNSSYVYRVAADNVAGTSAFSTQVTVPVSAPAAPVILTGTAVRAGANERATITWAPVPFATSYVIQRSLDPAFATGVTSATVGSVTTFTTGNISRTANWYFRMAAVNVLGQSGWSNVQTVTPAP
ncbi:MAG TPA: multicopper oxidase domain-containing protein [Ornithinibacter sp.]|nr:multicopper oxidase domain-containing protein [Ornithinibacter sp.]